jgi:nitrite reductase (NADH) small subunit
MTAQELTETVLTSGPAGRNPMTLDESEQATYTAVCRIEDIEVEGGVAALVEGAAVAIFRTHDGNVYAMSNWDPFSNASVLSRGIVGTRGDVPFVASPMYKQAFDLRTGQCLDDAAVQIPVHDVRVVDGTVLVGSRRQQLRQ